MHLASKYSTIWWFVFLSAKLFSQSDSIPKKHVLLELKTDTNVLFQTKKGMNDNHITEPTLNVNAYFSTYYAYYTEDHVSEFVKYPTMAARNNQFGLNMAMVSLAYKAKQVRSTITLHYGDIAESTWPATFKMIQEANAGIELCKNLWLDAGIFRSHIGLESTQPRENITSSMTLANVFEPYFFSGGKLTYLINSKLSVQLNAFNSFNSLIETNANKLFGASIVYAPNDALTVTYNFITGDDTPDTETIKHQRFYNNFYLTYQKSKWTVGTEINYGIQQNSKNNSQALADMNSALCVVKHQAFKKIAGYARGEWFSDRDEILSKGSRMGRFTYGLTAGVEYKPYKNVALSLEGRNLTSDNPNFSYNGYITNQRWESIVCLDVWF